MPALQNLVLTDRQTTPVNHTFIPRSLKDEVATVVKAGSSGAPIEDMIFSISSRRVNGRVKSVVKLKVPVVTTETVNGVARTVLLREAYIDATFTFALTARKVNATMPLACLRTLFLLARFWWKTRSSKRSRSTDQLRSSLGITPGDNTSRS